MTDAPELKPCPFCRDPMERYIAGVIRHTDAGTCILGQLAFTDIAEWNTRALTDQQAEIALLEGALHATCQREAEGIRRADARAEKAEAEINALKAEIARLRDYYEAVEENSND